MTELELAPQAALVPANGNGSGAASLAAWAEDAGAAYRVAEQLVKTSFVPQAFRDKPYEATAAILAGQEVGLSPMAALRSFDVINGTAAARAITLRAIVQSHGHSMWLVEATNTRAIVRGRRRGESEMQESVWTMDRAKGLGLAGKDNWRKQPMAMLVARATAECARLVASDALLGIPYTLEELDDMGGVDPTPVEQNGGRKAARRTARRAPVEPKEPAPIPEPELDEPAAETTPDEPDDGLEVFTPITGPQLKKLQVCLREYGITDRDAGLAYYADVIGREVGSSKELSKDEASQIIDQLDRELDKPDEQPEPTLDEPEGWAK